MTKSKVLYMGRVPSALLALRNSGVSLLKNTDGQDLIEYALLAGFVIVAAGAVMPEVVSQVSLIFSKLSSAVVASGR